MTKGVVSEVEDEDSGQIVIFNRKYLQCHEGDFEEIFCNKICWVWCLVAKDYDPVTLRRQFRHGTVVAGAE